MVTPFTLPVPETVTVNVVLSPTSISCLLKVASISNCPTRLAKSLGCPDLGRGRMVRG